MCRLQQQTTVLHAQQQQHEEKVEELWAEAERVTGIIQFVHWNVHEVANRIESNMWENVSSDLVEHMQKIEEEVHVEKNKLLKIVEDFQTKLSASQFME